MNKKIVIAALSVMFLLNACKKETDNFSLTPVDSYNPLVVGKYITYQMDSLVFINFGIQQAIHSYQVKYQVDGTLTDALNRKAYRIVRYIRNTPSDAWVPDNTFMSVNTNHSMEFMENNMRFIKLSLPIQNGFSWKGNSFIETSSINSDVKYMADWDYTYDSVNMPITLGTFSLDSTIKVNQRDEYIGGDVTDINTLYAEKNYGVEKYARNIGMVYKNFVHWEYQRPSPGSSFSYTGFGITLTMIDHN